MKQLQLPADWAGRMSRLSLLSSVKANSGHKGVHRTNRFGASMEFSDFREYAPGDDIRHIDWNVYGRTERVYIKRFLDEQDRSIQLLVDHSRSMEASWLFTKQLVYSFGIMALAADDRLSISSGSSGSAPFRKKGKNARKLLEYYIAGMAVPSSPFFAQRAAFDGIKRSSLMLVLSDGLEPVADWERFFRKAVRYSKDTRFLRIVSAEEEAPDYTGDVQLVDSETSRQLNVTVTPAALQRYEEQKRLHTAMLEKLCKRYGVLYTEVSAKEGIQEAIFKQLPKQNWIR